MKNKALIPRFTWNIHSCG